MQSAENELTSPRVLVDAGWGRGDLALSRLESLENVQLWSSMGQGSVSLNITAQVVAHLDNDVKSRDAIG